MGWAYLTVTSALFQNSLIWHPDSGSLELCSVLTHTSIRACNNRSSSLVTSVTRPAVPAWLEALCSWSPGSQTIWLHLQDCNIDLGCVMFWWPVGLFPACFSIEHNGGRTVTEMSLDTWELMPGVQSIAISKSLSQARSRDVDQPYCISCLTRDQLTSHEDLHPPCSGKAPVHFLLEEMSGEEITPCLLFLC